jgi:hypothetical protein
VIHTLSNTFIDVDIADVHSYQGTRFDRTGFITQVRLKHPDGCHTYCTFEKTEQDLRWEGGAGLCSEFGITEGIGYDEAEVGEVFPKLGVGLLAKLDSSPYAFNRRYPVRPFEIDYIQGKQDLLFVTHPLKCRGYAIRQHKRISLDQAGITIEYRLENLGTRIIHTTEYVHNFLNINGHPLGPDYSLQFSSPIEIIRMEEEYTPHVLHVQTDGIRWTRRPKREFYCQLTSRTPGQNVRWELFHEPSQAGMWEACSIPASHMAVWGAGHVVSPEVFVDIHLEPGETMTWSRQFGFFTKKLNSAAS